MKKTLTVLFFLLLFSIAAIAFLRVTPHRVPAPLKPALAWIEKTQHEVSGQFIAWRNRLLGIPVPTVARSPGATAVLSDSARAPDLARVDIGRSEVARVDIDEQGNTTISVAEPVSEPPVAVARPEPEASPPAVDSNIALAALTDTEAVISAADAAIAAADAALARAQGLGPETATRRTDEPGKSESIPADPQRLSGGSTAGGAAIVLSQTVRLKPAGTDEPNAADSRLVALAESTSPNVLDERSSVGSGNDGVNRRSPVTDTSVAAGIGPRAADPAVGVAERSQTHPVNNVAAAKPATPTKPRAQATPQSPPQSPLAQQPPALLKLLPARKSEPLQLSALPASALRAPEIIPPDAPLPPLPVTQAGREQQATISHFLTGRVVEFETGRDVLTRPGQQALSQLLAIIQAHQDTIITIQGHTDNVGDEASNLELSSARSVRARAYLIARGVEPDRLRVQGFGERRPLASNRTVEGRIRNRRIDFAVSDR